MSLPPRESEQIVQLRASIARAEATAQVAEARSRTARAELTLLEGGGAAPRELAFKRAQVQAIEREQAQVRAGLIDLRRDLDELLQNFLDPPFANLRADTPVLLLPVRIETRYGASVEDDLRVRIFPDQAHVDAHETELTADEREAAAFYWRTRWSAATPEAEVDAGRGAWGQLVRRFRPRRAAWIVQAMRPANLAATPRAAEPVFPDVALREHAWSRPSVAALLPRQWVVVGYVRDGAGQLRAWFTKRSGTVPDRLNTSIDPQAEQEVPVDEHGNATELPLDKGLHWLTDFATAEAAGMAVRIVPGDCDQRVRVASIRATVIERLVVYGIDPSPPQAGAAALEQALRAHVYSDGIAILQPGTPTNNGDAESAGFDASDAALSAAMDPQRTPPSPVPALDLLARALGIDPAAAHVDRIEGAALSDQQITADLVNATWMATLGQTMDQMLDPDLSDADITAARAFCMAWLRPGGPLPALRIGRQPYGLLPIVAPGSFQPADGQDRRLNQVLDAVRGLWEHGAAKAPTMARAGASVTDTMEALLQQGPMCRTNSYRRALGPMVTANSSLDPKLTEAQQHVRRSAFAALNLSPKVRLGTITLEGDDQRLGAPFVQARIATPTQTLAPNYLEAMVGEARRSDARVALGKRSTGGSLLEALCAHALVQELDNTIALVVLDTQVSAGVIAAMPAKTSMRITEALGVATIGAVVRGGIGQRRSVTVTDRGELASVTLDSIGDGRPIGDYIVSHITDRTAPIWRWGESFRSVSASLSRLSACPAAQLDRVFRGVLDAYSWRVDPWITALATKRLAFWRERGGMGVHLGGFGWVERLARDQRPQSEGFIHAPSIQHAQTAAVLRSGHLAHRDATGEALAIDLSSRRVRLALKMLEGVAQGQSMAALLGYRFERSLRDRDIALAKYILPIRKRFPLKPAAGESILAQQEAIAARDVVDGVKLLDAWRAGGDWLAGTDPLPAGTHRQAIEGCVAAIDDVLDATSDLLVAEGVHQLVGGNLERASAALAGLDRQARPVDPEVIRTPRSGRAFVQRAGVLLTQDAVPDGWAEFDIRARAEPLGNRWIGKLIGDPARYRFGARLLLADGTSRDLAPVALADLGWSPITLLMLSAAGGKGEASELRERIARLFAGQVAPAERDADAALSLLGDAPAGHVKGLACLEALLARIREVAGRHRAAAPADLVAPGVEVDSLADPAIIAKRAEQVRDALESAREMLATALAGDSASKLAAALDAASRAGASGATVCAFDFVPLHEQANDVAGRLDRLLQREAEAAAAIAFELERADALAAQVRRLKLLLGESFPVLPPFALPDGLAAALMSSLRDRIALLGDAPAALHGWMTRMAEVRPHLAELAGCLVAAEIAGFEPAPLMVAQLPHAEGARWIGLPLDKTTPEQIDLSLVVHAPDLKPGDQTPPLFAGFVSDSWTEVIPSGQETTAITFHYDAPGARPPQAMLLAVHPDPGATRWKPSQILATVNEAADLAAMRAVRPQDLEVAGAVLPLIYLPDQYSYDVPGIDFRAMYDKVRATIPPHLVNVLGKG